MVASLTGSIIEDSMESSGREPNTQNHILRQQAAFGNQRSRLGESHGFNSSINGARNNHMRQDSLTSDFMNTYEDLENDLSK
jgi:hypothetical protein